MTINWDNPFVFGAGIVSLVFALSSGIIFLVEAENSSAIREQTIKIYMVEGNVVYVGVGTLVEGNVVYVGVGTLLAAPEVLEKIKEIDWGYQYVVTVRGMGYFFYKSTILSIDKKIILEDLK